MYAPSPMMHRGATVDGVRVPQGDMKRRDFIKLVGGACATSAVSVARSQEVGRTPRIGILADDRILTDPHGAPNWRAFFEELAAGGFIEGTNLQVVRRGFGLKIGYSGQRVGARTTRCSFRISDTGRARRKARNPQHTSSGDG